MISRFLFVNFAEVYRIRNRMFQGQTKAVFTKANDIFDEVHGVPGEFWCRLDTSYFRRGKDTPNSLLAPNMPARSGLVVCDFTPYFLPGDILKFVDGPVIGNFKLDQPPDVAQNGGGAHHVEFYVNEITNAEIIDLYPPVESE